ncbi:HAD family hydrolase [Marinicrinis sediminis]|uniref:HAD family hydrolase n=1 Tax=Marinicrinis sediminis TaxID=1652465 RepID=A0ABW5R9J0_9BACL
MNMQTLKRPQAMIFDLDGTLFQTETLLIPTFERTFETLRAEGKYEGDTPPVERMIQNLGQLLKDIWEDVMPGASPELVQEVDHQFLKEELEGLARGEGQLYPDVAEVMQQLKEAGVDLYIASNGLEPYVKGVLDKKGLTPWLDGIYSAGEFRTASKVELVQLLLKRHHLTEAWMVGDRSSDVEAGHANQLPVIGCAYAGFGDHTEIADADVKITEFRTLLELYQQAE